MVSLESARAPFDSKIVKVSRLSRQSARRPSARLSGSFRRGCVHQSQRDIAQAFPFSERETETDGKLPQRKQPGFNECFFSPPPTPLPRDLIKKFLVIDRARRLGCMKVSLSDCFFLSHMSSLGCFLCISSSGTGKRLSRVAPRGSNHLHVDTL